MTGEDKIILTLLFSLILTIFLDFQAKKQYNLVNKEVKKISIDELVGDDFNKLKRKVEENKELIEEETASIQDKYDNIKQHIKDTKKEYEKTIQEQSKIKKIEELKKSLNDELKNPYLRNINQLTLPYDDSNITQIFLYFPKFKDNKKTEMYQVKRKVKGAITPLTALTILQKGPLSEEAGLVNAFYDKIRIKNIDFIEDDGIINLYFDENFISKSSIIMNDRIHQICLTLKQFQNIKFIQIWINEDLYIKQKECNRNFIEYQP